MSAGIQTPAKGLTLPTKILIGLLAGATLGVTANIVLGRTHDFVTDVNTYLAGPIGAIFLNLLFMIVVPLVFASIVLGVAGLGDVRKLGTVGTRTIAFFLITTAAAAALGLILVMLLRPGTQVEPELRETLMQTYAADAGARVQAAEQSTFGVQTVVNIVTRNPLKSAIDMDLLGLIFFAIMWGAALTMIRPEKAMPMLAWLESVQEIVIKIVQIAMLLAPYGVAALIFGVTSRFGFSLLAPLAIYVATVLGGLLLHMALPISGIVRFGVGLSPILFYKRIWNAMVTAFSTSSSAATLSTNIVVSTQNLGVPQNIAGFVLPMGNTMCMNGTALFEGVTVIFLAQVFGVILSVPDMIVIIVMCVLTAVGAAGVPGGSIPLLVGVMMMFGVPGEGIALILGVDRILDMSRTVVNIVGDHSATLFVAKMEGVWTPADVPALGELPRKLDDSPGWPG